MRSIITKFLISLIAVPFAYTQQASDTFTGITATSIDARSPDQGGNWTVHAPTGCSWVGTSADRVRTNGTECFAYNGTSIAATQADTVACDKAAAAFSYCGLLLRADGSGHNGYVLYWDQFGGEFTMNKIVSGTRNSLSCTTTVTGFAAFDILRFEASGTTTVSLNGYAYAAGGSPGAAQLTCSDSSSAYASGTAGMFAYTGATYDMDSFLAYDDAGGGGGGSGALPAIISGPRGGHHWTRR